MIYWFTTAPAPKLTTGAYRAVEFIKANIKLDGAAPPASLTAKRSSRFAPSTRRKACSHLYRRVLRHLGFRLRPNRSFSSATFSPSPSFGLYQAIFMANAGGAWDNAKKIVEVEMKQKGTPLHDATVIGDTVGDPFKDTSSVALNPVIKFTTLFGLLAVELAVQMTASQGSGLTHIPRCGVLSSSPSSSSIVPSTACASATGAAS